MRLQKAQRGFFVAVIGQHGLADAHADRQHNDIITLDEVLRQVARTVHYDPDTHRHPSACCVVCSANAIQTLLCVDLTWRLVRGVYRVDGRGVGARRFRRHYTTAPG
ncbi:hypothetical protein A11M_0102570 [Xanthomonas vasicola pv. vasculorum NCPPB 895]|uniref:Uncharacterized protein n=1 Tax=Xanthomonas vasicola pv. vasculorum NCPPB 890 TaxID=1184265 RepID=A0A836NZT9_XANVA|nr:hypothetical protein A11M_0102570 [Xanthomonas vasicola pv. vasculorum NCPPB 895]KFA28814.1 hypothetical protein KW5_0108955 [Xanthomonas vasicola pv. vasculorum NCPPB 1326]KFA35130.1 hypothetical protein KWG_0102510 [Xanthomonas vasicola pv. vasculorum NCPPB 1381]KFA37607.1 hypothetical protein KWI_0104575 [Xanthomonas vasicola pv. vasculorum NCPPB 206]